jgi:hypothetical protein
MTQSRNWLTTRVQFLLPVLLAIATAAPAFAQGVGVRGGISVDPDQVYFGGHYETDALIDRVHFRPNLEIGLGDDLVTTSINMEFLYKFPARSGWGLYAGGGPAVNFYSFNDPRGDGTETEGGLNLIIGAENRSGLFFEAKIGAVDSPDVKFGVGWSFR